LLVLQFKNCRSPGFIPFRKTRGPGQVGGAAMEPRTAGGTYKFNRSIPGIDENSESQLLN